ncbi:MULTISPECIES: carboxymuconolactone decarboxylase family protein [Bacillus]|uniref:Carboxymuconolactone decarboxylase family protein n=1 Tax=Bacillus glycinifermentans TaxID=1664069 RepID=A0AAJ3YVB3_9BACI|nr:MULTISPECIES: carboxymuconolactone decarboxylase family protein [Bacillus]KKB72959.1 carboxymuconolactone decarboxylase [Bacillus sp. TH008]MBU8788175.1 carboxymuconolactone decarboxylase family protein [Bacillus glycinifermentans]MDU0073756.1 carboxymuconolactone decarboxylase family protein [Bacillus sp. IG6]MED8021650.1 carboxymuconolactone decarboxylase family protein [Bacillus glycinifermentans]NUJ18348.1 carboxymuconolactone decarboxylase family protein [Bacillus glycinifermentans]
MDQERYTRGFENLRAIDGEGGRKVIDSLKDIAPDLGRYIVEFAFGDIYSREGLTLKERELITISALTAQGGCEAQLHVHINAGLNVGLTPLQITETMLQCVPYTGFPRVLNAVNVAKRVFQEQH